MSIKSRGRSIGRKVRRCTGLPLPVAMSIGKAIAQGVSPDELQKKFSEVFTSIPWKCGDGCCAGPLHSLKGPKGSIEGFYAFDEKTVNKEYSFMEAK